MIKRIPEYFELSKEIDYGNSTTETWIRYISYFLIFIISSYLLNKNVDISKIVKESSQELINAFTLISGFMLTGISIMLATGKVNNIEKLKQHWDTQDENEIFNIINKIKKLLFYEIMFQFIFIVIINIMIAFIKGLNITNNITLTILIFFSLISLSLTYRLIKNFITFENIIEFKL